MFGAVTALIEDSSVTGVEQNSIGEASLDSLALTGLASSRAVSNLLLMQELNRLRALPPNWDSYGALAVRHEAILGALELLIQPLLARLGVPTLSANSDGSVNAMWSAPGVLLEVEFLGIDSIAFYFEDSTSGREIEESGFGAWDLLQEPTDLLVERLA